MSLPNYNSVGGGQFVPTVPPVVNEALTQLAAIFNLIANINNLLNLVESDVQAKSAQQEAHYQKKASRKSAIGEFATGVASVVGGAVSIGFAARAGLGLGLKANSTDKIDKELENAGKFKKALQETPTEASIVEKAGTPEENLKRTNSIEEMEKNFTSRAPTDENKALMARMTDEEKAASIDKIDEQTKSLNSQKAELENQQKNREVLMKGAEAASTLIQGLGKIGNGVATLQAGAARAQEVIARNLGSMAGSMASHFSQRSTSYLGFINSLYRTLADMAQTQVTR